MSYGEPSGNNLFSSPSVGGNYDIDTDCLSSADPTLKKLQLLNTDNRRFMSLLTKEKKYFLLSISIFHYIASR